MIQYSNEELKYFLEHTNKYTLLKKFFKELKIEYQENLKEFFDTHKLLVSQFKLLLEYYFANNKWPKCQICNKEHANFHRQILRHYCNNKKCTFEYSAKQRNDLYKQNPEILKKSNEKQRQTNLKKYGSEYSFTSKDFKQKYKETSLKNWGTENPLQSKIIKEKRENLCLEKYGHKSHLSSKEIQEKRKQTNQQKYGAEHITQSKYFKQKYKETSLKNWGTDWPVQNIEVLEKIMTKIEQIKYYTFPSGRRVKVQGYEPQCLDYLINVEKINENDILTQFENGCPKIKHTNRLYHPDIFIKSQNRIIEVKSLGTLNWHYADSMNKIESAKNNGYLTNIYIMDKVGNLLNII